MCGIAGFWTRGGGDCEGLSTVRAMTDAIAYRGPDDHGHWLDNDAGIALGHRRLSILDLSPQGHQPMPSHSGRYVIVFNGEVYNFDEIRRDVRGIAWRGHSDTEVMLASIEKWGLEKAVRRFVGMFAFALFDRESRELHLVRDRLGIKPLYYAWMGNTFLFGSELKALRAHSGFDPQLDRSALALFMRHNYIPAPYTIYRGVRKLTPGTILTLKEANDHTDPKPFWSAREVVECATANPFLGSDEDAVEQLEQLLTRAVGLRMVSDVPLGAFLSGGVDSSLVVALMQAQSSRPVRTFSIGFQENGFNEAEHAAKVAKHLGTDHTELYVTDTEAREVIPRLHEMYDEPFADSSQIPTFLVSKLARDQVTVSLSGDGGDEVFGGYTRYLVSSELWNKLRLYPTELRHGLSKLVRRVPIQVWNAGFAAVRWATPTRWRRLSPGEKVQSFADILDARQAEDLYVRVLVHWPERTCVVRESGDYATNISDRSRWADVPDLIQSMMFVDAVSYLPDDILTKVDRASMSVGLEARVPLLDHRVFEFAWRLPLHMKVRNGTGKWILRQVLYRDVPRELIERPKMGFGVPVGEWLRGSLRGWAEDLLSDACRSGIVNNTLVQETWREHLSGRSNWQYRLWNVLMFQAWYAAQSSSRQKPAAARA